MKITSGTLARTIILALALINQVLSMCGIAVLPIEDAQVETIDDDAMDCDRRSSGVVEKTQASSAAIAR